MTYFFISSALSLFPICPPVQSQHCFQMYKNSNKIVPQAKTHLDLHCLSILDTIGKWNYKESKLYAEENGSIDILSGCHLLWNLVCSLACFEKSKVATLLISLRPIVIIVCGIQM